MHYIDVQWIHQHAAEPVRLVSELDDQRFEVRKLELFRTGEVGYATEDLAERGTELGEGPVPTLNEINVDPSSKESRLKHRCLKRCGNAT